MVYVELTRQDGQGVRTLADIERKYNLPSLLKNIEIQRGELIKIENELNNTISSLIINLNGLVDNQGEASLWFFFGTPSVSVEPESEWTTTELKDDHVGDLYYDKGTGRVYQYLSDYTWVERQDARLIQAMALTNAVAEEERKIFFSQPTPPYVNGDWWIKDNGDLWICQITRMTGSYTEDDFIKSSLFAPSENMTEANQFTILSGAITLIRQGINIIEQTVSTHTQSLNNLTGELALISENYTTQTQTATQISLAVAQVNQAIETAKGEITSVTTTTGYVFDKDGLQITKTGEDLSTEITNEGLYVTRDKGEASEVEMLKADSTGVNAENITVRKYLVMGTNSRMEDFEDELGPGTGLFFVGGA